VRYLRRAAAVVAGAAAVLAMSAWSGISNQESTRLFMYANGVSGSDVFAHLKDIGSANEAGEWIAVTGPCGTNHVADGNDGDDGGCPPGTWWPSSDHNRDLEADTGTVNRLANPNYSFCYIGTQGGAAVYQDFCTTSGNLWMMIPQGTNPASSLFESVRASNFEGRQIVACSNGNGPAITTEIPYMCTGPQEHWYRTSS
jgi:hypothetical protein